MMDVKCNLCKKDMLEKGALIITPPVVSYSPFDTTYKLHVCLTCWENLWKWLVDRGLLDIV